MPKQEIDATELYDLALSIVGLVLSEGDQKVEELASRFSVSEKVVLKAVRAITDSEDLTKCVTHFHLNFDEFEDGWISFAKGSTNLEGPPVLSKRQLSSIAIGLDYLASIPQFATNPALMELRRILKNSGPVPVTTIAANRLSELLEQLHEAISSERTIICNYRNQKGEQSQRSIDPLLIELRGKKHYLRGWCHINKEVRSFRLDRMQSVQITDQIITNQSRSAAIPDEVFGSNLDEQIVVLAAQPEATEIFWNFPGASEPVLEKGKWVGKIRVGSLAGLPRHIIRYGGMVEVLEPKEARTMVANFAREVLAGADPKDED
jgi:proteasome accessory factor C